MEVLKLSLGELIPVGFTGIVEWSDGECWWYKHGANHREDGPAMMGPCGYYSYWLNNKKYPSKEEWFNALTDEQKINAVWNF